MCTSKNKKKVKMSKENTEKKQLKSIQNIAIDFIQHKSEPLFIELTTRLKPGLRLFVKKYVGNKSALIDEIISATFVSMWEKLTQYNSNYNFSTWVYAIARNEALGRIRADKKTYSHDMLVENHSKTLKLYSEVYYMDLECVGPNNDELTQHLYDLTINEINLLEEPYKTVMFEREINQLQLTDIADLLGWNLNTVKTRLVKARKDIASNLTKKYPELIDAYNEHEI